MNGIHYAKTFQKPNDDCIFELVVARWVKMSDVLFAIDVGL